MNMPNWLPEVLIAGLRHCTYAHHNQILPVSVRVVLVNKAIPPLASHDRRVILPIL